MSNDLIQWICVAVVFVIIVVWVVRYVRGLIIWSKGMKRPGGGGVPPCCGGNRGKNAARDCQGKDAAKDCCAGKEKKKSRHAGGPCAGCGADCPLSGLRDNRSENQKL